MEKYIKLIEAALSVSDADEARVMAVPAHMEAKKKALIEGREAHYKRMKEALAAYEKRQAKGVVGR